MASGDTENTQFDAPPTKWGEDAEDTPQEEGNEQPYNPAENQTYTKKELTEDEKSHRKIFVGGLSRNTTSDHLQEYFSQFGDVVDAVVLFDKLTGRSRGFGFVTFYDLDKIDKVVDQQHKIDEFRVDVRRALPRDSRQGNGERYNDNADRDSGRVFVGGLTEEVTEEVLREYFSKYGELASANAVVDRDTGRARGFGFVIFKDPSCVEKVIGRHSELAPNCEAKKAQPRNTNQNRFDQRGMSEHDGYNNNGYYSSYNQYYAAYYAQAAAAYQNGMGYNQQYAGGNYGRNRGQARSTPY